MHDDGAIWVIIFLLCVIGAGVASYIHHLRNGSKFLEFLGSSFVLGAVYSFLRLLIEALK